MNYNRCLWCGVLFFSNAPHLYDYRCRDRYTELNGGFTTKSEEDTLFDPIAEASDRIERAVDDAWERNNLCYT